MIVTFALQEEHPFSPVLPRADLMVASVKHFMPHAKIVQLSNLTFPAAEGVDEVIRTPNNGDFIEWAFGSLIQLLKRGEPVLQIATDILLTADVSDVFEKDFDIAACRYLFCDRQDGAYCGDVNFIQPSGLRFWEDVLEYYLMHPPIRDGWEGGQTAFLQVANLKKYRVLDLDFKTYCYTPDDIKEDISNAKIVHFRGNRKPLMPFYAEPLKLQKLFNPQVIGNVPDSVMEDNVKKALSLPVEILAAQYVDITYERLLIVGGGPSLKENLLQIKLMQEGGAVVWALNGAFKYLCDHGIDPEAHIMLDAREENIDFVPENTDSMLLYSAQCHPRVLAKARMASRKLILWCPAIEGIIEILNERKLLAAIISGGSSVGLKSLALAQIFGFQDIHLFGYDSSYRDNDNHAYKQPLNDNERVLEVTVGGKTFKCAWWMATQAQEFQISMLGFLKRGMEFKVHGDGLLPHIASIISV